MSEGERLADTITVKERKGMVLIGTPERPIAALDPEAARQLAEALARLSYTAKFGHDMTPKGQSAVTRQVKQTLVNRVSVMLRSLLDQRKPRIYIAETIVNEVLARAL